MKPEEALIVTLDAKNQIFEFLMKHRIKYDAYEHQEYLKSFIIIIDERRINMNIVCLDLEGVLVPEIWIAFAEASGIPELKRTTRDEPDYDKLMKSPVSEDECADFFASMRDLLAED